MKRISTMLAGTHFLSLIALVGIATAQQQCMINFNGTAGNHFMFLANGGKEETLTLEGDPECHLRYSTKFLFSDDKNSGQNIINCQQTQQYLFKYIQGTFSTRKFTIGTYSRLRNVTTGCFVQHTWFIRNVS